MNNNGNLFDHAAYDAPVPAKSQAIASLVLGIMSVALFALNFLLEITVTGGLVFGIIGVVMAGVAKKKGNVSGIRTAGQILSIIGIVLNALFFVACAGLLGCASCLLCAGMGAAL